MRKDEVVAVESHRFLSEKRKVSRIGHHGRRQEILITCYTPGPFGKGKFARVSSAAFKGLREVSPTVEESSILPPDTKEAAVRIILHSIRYL